MASSKERAWLAAHQKGSKALVAKLDKAHANNPEYQAFKKKHGLENTSSVKQVSKSQVDAKKEKARQALAAKAYGATKGTRMGSADGTGETLRDTIAPLSPEQHSAVKAAERTAKAAAKPAKPKKEKKAAAKPEESRLDIIKRLAAKRTINAPPVPAKTLRRIAAVGNMEHEHGGFDDLSDTSYGGYRGRYNMDEAAPLDHESANARRVAAMPKGSILGSKDDIKAHLEYLKARHAHLKKFGYSTKQVADKIGRVNHLLTQKEEVEQIDEASDLHCPSCGTNHGKDRENPKDKTCSSCGHKFKNIHGYSNETDNDSEAAAWLKRFNAKNPVKEDATSAMSDKLKKKNINTKDMNTLGKLHALMSKEKAKRKPVSESYDKAEEHKAKAAKALETSDMEAYHQHMSNHHEELGKWHESKGRGDLAQRSFDKAEKHHEMSLNPDKSKTLKSVKEEVWDEPNPKKTSKALSASQKARAKARARAAGRSYPNLVDNMWASKLGEGIIDNFVAKKIAAYHGDKVKGSVEQSDAAREAVTKKMEPIKRKIERIKARASYKDKSHARHDETKLDLKHANDEHAALKAERAKHYDAFKNASAERDSNIASDMKTYDKYGLVGLGLKRLKQRMQKEETMKEGFLSKLLGKKPVAKPKTTPAHKSVGYQGLPAEWSQEKRGNEYYANKQMAGLKKEEAMKDEYKEPFEGGKTPSKNKGIVAGKSRPEGMSRVAHLARLALKKKAMKEGYMKANMPEDDDDGESDMAEYERQAKKGKGVRAYDKNGKLVGNYRSMEDAKKFKPGHTYKEEVTPTPVHKLNPGLQAKIDAASKMKKPRQAGTPSIDKIKLITREEKDYAAVAPVPGDKWKSHAIMVHPETKQRVVVLRKNAKNYPKADGWKEVAPGMKEEAEQIDEMDSEGYRGTSDPHYSSFAGKKWIEAKVITPKQAAKGAAKIFKNILKKKPKHVKEEAEQIDEVISAKERKWREAVIDRHGDTVRFKKKRHVDAKTYHTVAFKGNSDKYVGNFLHSGKMAGGATFPARAGAGGKWTEVSEDIEQIQEVGPQKKMRRMLNKLRDARAGEKYKRTSGMPVPDREPGHKDTVDHNKALGRALRKLGPAKLAEVLKPSMGADEYVSHFVRSKNPKFEGKSKAKRIQMALGAYYGDKKGMKEGLDPVGKEDADVNNDGKHGHSTDKYLLKRRAAISKAMAKKGK
jgi:hypothetical protein